MGASSRRSCPQCGVDSVQLSLANVRRRRRVTCHSCGTKLEIVVPTALYTLVTLSAVILGSMLVPVLLMSIFEKKWTAIALAVALLFALIFGSNELLNRRATVQRLD
ncbi:MAG TPA: hypothetical protein VEW08_10510 [Steroidobacteraceae bacterium]|nr:hypothetical protein [Steroidobacteraceae bacterium]